ncbi:pilus assembly protein [Legionella dresdenensis]|uniref:Pilus assembly protein n=1 Tax=Legionella dresdenensis TaxID=450200 RepID=A0ABV8CCH3_9GAMM
MYRSWLQIFLLLLVVAPQVSAAPLDISQSPLFITDRVPPLNMLVMSRDHKLYFEAYNDTSDIDGDGQIDIYFKPSIFYYGYFDNKKCYAYNSSGQYFYPTSVTADGKCPGSWSGNFLNYLTTSRLDAIRKVLYGGYRQTDSTSATILERAYIPQDGHSWGKEFQSLAVNGYNIGDYTPLTTPSAGKYHLFANTTLRNGTTNPLLRVALNQPYRIWEWVSIEVPVAGSRALNGGSGPLISGITDYVVRVKVCDSAVGLEDNCRLYPNGQYKPIGLLQEFGENNSMMFGLMTGSYKNNLSGGVLRKNISSITNEINLNTGQFTTVNGIISAINKLTVTSFGTDYNYSCGYISTRNIVNGECEMWGNPLAEIMYEAVRYLAGKGAATAAFNYSTGPDVTLGLPKPAWQNPYSTNPYCAKSNILVLSDVEPTYDSDQVPGSYFDSFSGDLNPPLDANGLAQTIFNYEGFSSVLAFIGQSQGNNDGAPTPKIVTGFGNIRGLAPQETNSQGSYYPASVSYYAYTNDLNSAKGEQNAKSYFVALSSPKPQIKFKVGNNTITIIPFGKSVSGLSINSAQGQYQPTNEIVDFYIESLTDTGGVFRVNFADLQQGADFDMDAIVKYTITVNANNTLTITSESIYAAGSIIQHMGYIISGTTADGVYLEVRDLDTPLSSDIDYFLNTPRGRLPTIATRVFTPSGTPSAITFNSPLWYAAKWGGFNDTNGNNVPDVVSEYSSSESGDPDNYFMVTNANNLRLSLAKAFEQILDRSGSFSAAALSSGFLTSNTRIYQAIFKTKDWSGQLLSYAIDPATGNILTNGGGPMGSLWDAAVKLNAQNYNSGRNILTYKPSTRKGIKFRWPSNAAMPGTSDLDTVQINALNLNPVTGVADGLGGIRLNYLRGDKSQESSNGGSFRNRSTLLGDIINSTPIVIGAPSLFYPAIWSGSAAENAVSYSSFRQNNLNRKPVIYVGSNDGLLHAFDAMEGNELFAYVPSEVYSNLNQLTNAAYTHRYYTDGSPTVIDVFASGNWRTMLVGTLNAGGQGVYALDVTDPAQFTEANAGNIVKWEFNDNDDIDMGYSYSQAAIVRLANGEWAAIFGNGYNNTVSDGRVSTTGNAVLYIVNITTGALIKKLDTGVGMSQDPLNQGRPNGMSSPIVVDLDGNFIADYIYVGDLFGNLWKIDITSENPNSWDFSYKKSGKPSPFFVAVDSNGKRQPITARPTVSRLNYSSFGLQIYIATGKYIETSDKTDVSVQSVYALRDDNTTAISGRAQLRQQFILSEDNNARVVSDNLLANNDRGWYLDLIVNGQARGERVVSSLLYISGKLIFSTIIPTSDPCDYGGESWLMELNALNGSRLNYNVFDMNRDGAFNESDSVTYSSGGTSNLVPASGLKSEVGLITTPSVLNAGTKEYKYLPGTSGGIQKVGENPGQQIFGRQSWRQYQ